MEKFVEHEIIGDVIDDLPEQILQVCHYTGFSFDFVRVKNKIN